MPPRERPRGNDGAGDPAKYSRPSERGREFPPSHRGLPLRETVSQYVNVRHNISAAEKAALPTQETTSVSHRVVPAERGTDTVTWHEIPRLQGRQFFEGTIKAFLKSMGKHIIKRVVDLIAPGFGGLLDVAERVMSFARVLRTVTEGSGTLDVPVLKAGGIDFMLDIRMGSDRTSSELPVSAYLAPGNGGQFGGFEAKPLKHHLRQPHSTGEGPPIAVGNVTELTEGRHTRVVLAEADLSVLIDLPEPSAAASVLRDWAEQQLRPELLESLGENSRLELVIVFDPQLGVGTWVRLPAGESDWRMILRTDPQTQALDIDVVRVVPAR